MLERSADAMAGMGMPLNQKVGPEPDRNLNVPHLRRGDAH